MSVEADLLAMLAAVPYLTVYDGYVDADETQKVISVELPYVVFYSTPGYDTGEVLSGDVNGRVVEFQVTAVGETRVQAQAELDKARGALSRKRVGGNLIVRTDDNQFVRRDDDYTRPGGAALFYGVDRYEVVTGA